MKIGIDWGGTKIEGISIDPKNGTELNRIRVDSPKENYEEIVSKVVEVIKELSKDSKNFTVGIGMPGSIHPKTNLVQVSNTKALEGKPVKSDIETKLGYEIKIANDADCLALSERCGWSRQRLQKCFCSNSWHWGRRQVIPTIKK